ncbi:MAG: glycosyltransferase [Campylobacterota bacterium]|nr:glycosyltransferase [Campylobacterota bacterium]
MNKIKQFIKSIPLVGWLLRWSYNLLRLNNIKHTLFILQQTVLQKDKTTKENITKLNKQLLENKKQLEQKIEQKLQQQAKQYEAKLKKLQDTISKHQKQHDDIEHIMKEHVRQQLATQTIYFHQKLDNYLTSEDRDQSSEFRVQNPKIAKDQLQKDYLDNYYLAFENKFRGSRESILKRYEAYLKFVPLLNTTDYQLATTSSALDIGCGRAEWVQLLQQRGIDSRGIDLNPAMLQVGFDNNVQNLEEADAFEYLSKCEDNTFDIITAFHIIEHIPFEKLIILLQHIKRVAKPNATILLETPNPQNIQVAACNFYNDPTHLNPLPAPVIKFLVQYIGFQNVKINYLNPKEILPTTNYPLPTEAQDYLITATNTPSPNDKIKKKFLFDLSFYHRKNLGTGIHKVVEHQLKALQQLDQEEYEFIPVYQDHKNNQFTPTENTTHYPLLTTNLKKGDILFSSDLSVSDIQKAMQSGLYESYKQKGVKIAFLVHDILPMQHPEFFAQGQKRIHETYIKNISQISDILITTTQVGKKELKQYLVNNNLKVPKIEPIHLGTKKTTNYPLPATNYPLHTTHFNFLIVSTIEPRKAHAQLIDAFDIIWNDPTPNTKQPTLTIVGKKGWMVEDTIAMIENHPLLNKNLFYREFISDEELSKLYQKSNCVIVSSYAEGFGLPLIEAASYNKPIIARDIEVFKEIMGDYPIYFKDTKDPQDIADKINHFIENQQQFITHNPHPAKCLTWQQHTTKLLEILT